MVMNILTVLFDMDIYYLCSVPSDFRVFKISKGQGGCVAQMRKQGSAYEYVTW
jgi:hypothetical protein